MIVVELIIVLLAIFLGARLGGIGIGFAGGLGVLVLAAIGVKPGTIPFDVISIIMAVIAAISAMQVAGRSGLFGKPDGKNCCVRTRNTSPSSLRL
nr:anaerobic C4-dicarboxylate transporter [Salmonella sp. NCTC 7297]